MQTLVASIPLIVLVGGLLGGAGPLRSASIAVLSAIVTAFFFLDSGAVFPALLATLPGLTVLVWTVVAVIFPGLWFVRVADDVGANSALQDWVRGWNYSTSTTALLITVLIAPGIEAITGFGVSMVFSVPLLVGLLRIEKALRLGLLGMLIMPWGTLGLATIIGSSLAGVSAHELGSTSSLASFFVFPSAALIAARLAERSNLATYALAFAIGILFSCFLVFFNFVAGPTLAGVAAAFSALVLFLMLSRYLGYRIGRPKKQSGLFGLLIIFVLFQRLIYTYVPGASDLGFSLGEFDWILLESPGVPLLLAAFVYRLNLAGSRQAASKAARPIASVLLLLALSQIMVRSGQMSVIASAIRELTATAGEPVYAFVAAFSGYISGSNVAANALLMPTARILDSGNNISFAAIQNSASGHAVLASIPIVTLLISIAGRNVVTDGLENRLLIFGATVAFLNAALVALSAFFLI